MPSSSTLRPLLLLAMLTAGCAEPRSDHPLPDAATIDSTVRALMAREGVEGLALAVIDAGQVAHLATWGVRDTARTLPLTPQTIMYGASLTKTAVAYLALMLVDEGRLDLDATVEQLLPRPLPEYEEFTDLASDERWRQLTPRILLTHSSGFANFRWLEPDQRLQFHHDPGTRYGYSGEGFYILQLVIEEGLGLELGAEMQRRLFQPFGMTRTSMEWRPDFAENLADGFGLDGTTEPHDERSRPSSAGSMDTSIEDQARLWAAIVRGEGLSPASRAELIRPQLSIASAHQFPTLDDATDPRNAQIQLSAGLGLVTFQDASSPAWFKGGHNDWTGNMVICLERGQRCVVMLANDVRAERIYPAIARLILGETSMPWYWEYDD